MREHVDHSIELFNATLGAARSVDDDRLTTYPHDASRQATQRIAQPHCLSQPGRHPLDHGTSALGSLVARSEPCSTRRHDQPREPVAQVDQLLCHEFSTVSRHLMSNHVKAGFVQVLDEVEEVFPFDGRLVFESMGGGTEFETQRAKSLREAYIERLAARRARLSDLAGQLGWRCLFHRTSQSPRSALLWLYMALGEGM